MARIRGANNFHTAEVTENSKDNYTVGTLTKTERIINIELDVKEDSEVLYSDDEIEEYVYGTPERTGKVELNYLSNDTKVKLIGGVIDKNGVYFPPAEDAAKKHVALAFKAPTGGGKARLVVYYDVVFTEPQFKAETAESKPKSSTCELEFVCYKNKKIDKHYADLDTNGEESNSIIEGKWFTEVYDEIADAITVETP